MLDSSSGAPSPESNVEARTLAYTIYIRKPVGIQLLYWTFQ